MIKYPNNIQKNNLTKIHYFGNRGMSLENDLNDTNSYYLEKDIAIIHKKPTPIQVVDTKNGKIINAYFKEPSTTDYNGLYRGYYIDFEAKETNNESNFSLKNIHKHQLIHMEKILNHGGICFLIVRFIKLDKTFLLFADKLINYIKESERKSIPISFFKEEGHSIKYNLKIKVDYLSIVDQYGGIK